MYKPIVVFLASVLLTGAALAQDGPRRTAQVPPAVLSELVDPALDFRALTPEQRAEARKQAETRWQAMSAEEKKAVIDKIRARHMAMRGPERDRRDFRDDRRDRRRDDRRDDRRDRRRDHRDDRRDHHRG